MTTATAPTPTVADEVHTTDERLARLSPWKRLLVRPEFGALAGAVVVWLLFAWQAKSVWLSWQGTATYLDTSAAYGLTAVAVALLMIGGEFDLSAGVMTGTTGMFAALFAVHSGLNLWPAMGLSLIIALFIGFLNGAMVVKSGLPSFIVTLGTFFALRGFNLWLTQQVTNQTQVTGISEASGYDFARKVFAADIVRIGGVGFRVSILWFLGMVAIGAWVLLRTRVGNWIFAVGGNRDAARMSGVPANATKIGLFMTVALCGWVHGMVVLMQTNRSNVIEGVGQEFFFIIAAVLGGCLLTGGFGSIVGAGLGCLILGMTARGISLAGWDNNLYFLFLGVILLLAAFSNEWIRRWARTASRPTVKVPDVAETGSTGATGGG
ncbi:MAG: ABC transporter permease [Acidimicrobiia bacterium]|jgi:simple sugar transport system permease protein|nr:ABC transporter permease [Euzebyaceae bacterium]MBA3982229.1 ABC transporter permease [Acidimicrobiia bacterium]